MKTSNPDFRESEPDLYVGNPTASYVAEHIPLDDEERKEFEECCEKYGLDITQYTNVRRSEDFAGWVAIGWNGETWIYDDWG